MAFNINVGIMYKSTKGLVKNSCLQVLSYTHGVFDDGALSGFARCRSLWSNFLFVFMVPAAIFSSLTLTTAVVIEDRICLSD